MAKGPSALVILMCAGLAACGARLGLGGSDTEEQAAAPPPQATPSQRAVQVAWTAASARYCAFGLNPQKLKSDYLAWEESNGALSDQIQTLDSAYDKAFLTFYNKVKEIPDYCSKKRIEQIRPEINRHLAGDYSPRAPRKIEEDGEPSLGPIPEEIFSN